MSIYSQRKLLQISQFENLTFSQLTFREISHLNRTTPCSFGETNRRLSCRKSPFYVFAHASLSDDMPHHMNIPQKVYRIHTQSANRFGYYRPTSETPFKWRFAGGSIAARCLKLILLAALFDAGHSYGVSLAGQS